MTLTFLMILILLALGLLGALSLFVTLKLEMEHRSRKERERVDAIMARLTESDVKAAAAATPIGFPGEPTYATGLPKSGLNLSKRVQVMRLLRHGEGISQIASSLGVSRREVELLVRVQTIVSDRLSKAAAAD